ncbi:MAG TPA: DUF6285 domain-containing protein [Candidatus Dormibacteraeota bacterium]|nr:DUF6285 domain-containing protein [Candidatus Dormibacteraeota bacterium]
MQDRPDAVELIAAVRHFLEHEVLPEQTEQRGRFRTLVAANALAIVEREIAVGPAPMEHERERLQALLRTERRDVRELRLQLARRIRRGEADAGGWREAVIAAARAGVEAKLAIANPRFLERRDVR